jgi:hypothetical protein
MTFNLQALYAEFPRDMVTWRPQGSVSKNNSIMALAYIDARDVMDRLDAVVGPANWSDDYFETAKGRVICTLSINVDGVWIRKSDGSGESDIEGEKGAISGALKRAAVKWGIGRYLYDLESPWVPCETYTDKRDGKVKFSKFSVDPWTKVRRKPRVFELPPPDNAQSAPEKPVETPHDPVTGEIADERNPPPPAPESAPRDDGATIRETFEQGIRDSLPADAPPRQFHEAVAAALAAKLSAYVDLKWLNACWDSHWRLISEMEAAEPDLHATLLAVKEQTRQKIETAPPKPKLSQQIGMNIVRGVGLCGDVAALEKYTDELGSGDLAFALDHPKIKQAFADRRRVLAEPVYFGDRQIG